MDPLLTCELHCTEKWQPASFVPALPISLMMDSMVTDYPISATNLTAIPSEVKLVALGTERK